MLTDDSEVDDIMDTSEFLNLSEIISIKSEYKIQIAFMFLFKNPLYRYQYWPI